LMVTTTKIAAGVSGASTCCGCGVGTSLTLTAPVDA
jgi:hypothetical protein